jgi:hypothetical protein
MLVGRPRDSALPDWQEQASLDPGADMSQTAKTKISPNEEAPW